MPSTRVLAILAALWAAAGTPGAVAAGDLAPNLDSIRYRDPPSRRTLWLGCDAGGAYVPESLGLANRTVWLVKVTPAWALALSDLVSAGGRHGWTWYDAQNIRLSVSTNELEVAVKPWREAAAARLHQRFSLGFERHRLESMRIRRAAGDGADTFFVGGVGDTVLRGGYAGEYAGESFAIGWDGQLRHASLYRSGQRQARLATRLSWLAGEGHSVFVEGVLFGVHRDATQGGRPLPRTSLHAQAVLGYDWMSAGGVGLLVRGRWLSSFFSGEAPFYELREESLAQQYAELVGGVALAWE